MEGESSIIDTDVKAPQKRVFFDHTQNISILTRKKDKVCNVFCLLSLGAL
jgi:hypothetical protein